MKKYPVPFSNLPLAVYRHWWQEDAPHGDITSQAVLQSSPRPAGAAFLAKQDLVVSGIGALRHFIKALKLPLVLKFVVNDGDFVKKGTRFGSVHGDEKNILRAERIFLNILQRLSGIATLTHFCVQKIQPSRVEILDTRKTHPGFRDWEKTAVVHGGGKNHRQNLSDMYLIKDNHITAAGGVVPALKKVFQHRDRDKKKKKLLVEIEVKTLEQLREVLPLRPDIVMLDNMSVAMIRQACMLRKKFLFGDKGWQVAAVGARHAVPLLEISGGVTEKNLKKMVACGVKRISMGCLTHSARAADISLKFCN